MNKKVLIIALGALVAVLGVFAFLQLKSPSDNPKNLIVKAITAAQKGDLKKFEEAVSIEMLSKYVVTHAYELAFPAETENKSASLLQQMAPDLEQTIAMQMRSLVKDVKARDNLRPWQDSLNFTQRLWAETLGTEDVVYKIKLKSSSDNPFIELEMRFPEEPEKPYNLYIGYKETDEGLKLASLPNIAQFLADLEPLRLQRQKFHRARIEESIAQSVKTTTEASISEGSWGKGRNVLVNVALENTTQKEISLVAGKILLKRGVQEIGSLDIEDTDLITAENMIEKTYNLHFKPLSNEAALIDAALKGNLGVDAVFKITEVQFTDGSRFKL